MDVTWHLIYRHLRGSPQVHSRTGIIDAVAAESVDRAIEIARARNPVRSCEYLEAQPIPRSKADVGRNIRNRRLRENEEFLALMVEGGWMESEFMQWAQ